MIVFSLKLVMSASISGALLLFYFLFSLVYSISYSPCCRFSRFFNRWFTWSKSLLCRLFHPLVWLLFIHFFFNLRPETEISIFSLVVNFIYKKCPYPKFPDQVENSWALKYTLKMNPNDTSLDLIGYNCIQYNGPPCIHNSITNYWNMIQNLPHLSITGWFCHCIKRGVRKQNDS